MSKISDNIDSSLDQLIRFLLPRRVLNLFSPESLLHYTANIKWLTVWKVTASLLSLGTTMLVARLLGPSQYGTLSYAMSISGMFGVIGSLGIGYLIYAELVKHKEQRLTILGNTIGLTLFMGAIAYIILAIFTIVTNEPVNIRTLILILALSYFTTPLTYLHVDFLKDGESKYVAFTQTITTLISSVAKILSIYVFSSLKLFVIVMAAENVIAALIYLYQIKAVKKRSLAFKATWPGMSSYFIAALPLTALVISSDLYSRIDQVLLKHIENVAAVGLYATAARLTEIWYVVPSVLITGFFPALANSPEKEYSKKYSLLGKLLLLTSVVVVLGTYIFGGKVISMIYGPNFSKATNLLFLYSLSLPGSFITMLMLHDLTIHSRRWQMVSLTGIIALINIALCIFLIPRTGATGAAIATAVSYNLGPALFALANRILRK